MKRKELLKAQGFEVSMGKGRLSRENVQRIADAQASGVVFDDAGRGDRNVTATRGATPKGDNGTATVPAKAVGPAILEPASPLWHANTRVYGMVEGRRVYVPLAQTCMVCHVSFRWCGCKNRQAMV